MHQGYAQLITDRRQLKTGRYAVEGIHSNIRSLKQLPSPLPRKGLHEGGNGNGWIYLGNPLCCYRNLRPAQIRNSGEELAVQIVFLEDIGINHHYPPQSEPG